MKNTIKKNTTTNNNINEPILFLCVHTRFYCSSAVPAKVEQITAGFVKLIFQSPKYYECIE